jgi:hypothetical protein
MRFRYATGAKREDAGRATDPLSLILDRFARLVRLKEKMRDLVD